MDLSQICTSELSAPAYPAGVGRHMRPSTISGGKNILNRDTSILIGRHTIFKKRRGMPFKDRRALSVT